MLKVKKLSTQALLPERANKYAAGYDLYLPEAYDIRVGLNKINLEIAIEIPPGHYARIACRSSMACIGYTVEAGVIDEDYRGPLCIMLRSRCNDSLPYGYKVAQMIITPYASPEVKEVESLSDTSRGEGGFGSTGSEHSDTQ